MSNEKIFEDATALTEEQRKEQAGIAIGGVLSSIMDYSGQVVTSIVGSIREPEEYEEAYKCVMEAKKLLGEAVSALD